MVTMRAPNFRKNQTFDWFMMRGRSGQVNVRLGQSSTLSQTVEEKLMNTAKSTIAHYDDVVARTNFLRHFTDYGRNFSVHARTGQSGQFIFEPPG